MLTNARRRLTYANVMATVAVFLALGGSSYAALRVGSRQIADNAVRSTDIRNNAVRSKDIRDGSLLAKEFKAGQLPVGQTGDAGAAGPQGPTGQQGSPGVSGLERVQGSSASNSNSLKSALAVCPAGKRAIGAGGDIQAGKSGGPPDTLIHVVIDEIIPSRETTVPGTVQVMAVEHEPYADNWVVAAYAICANVS